MCPLFCFLLSLWSLCEGLASHHGVDRSSHGVVSFPSGNLGILGRSSNQTSVTPRLFRMKEDIESILSFHNPSSSCGGQKRAAPFRWPRLLSFLLKSDRTVVHRRRVSSTLQSNTSTIETSIEKQTREGDASPTDSHVNHQLQPNDSDRETEESNHSENENPQPQRKIVSVITYRQRVYGLATRTWMALNTELDKFQGFLRYRGVSFSPTRGFEAYAVNMNSDEKSHRHRQEWQQIWKQERLLVDRTELIASYQSDRQPPKQLHGGSVPKQRRGGFSDQVHVYVDRLIGILQDEQDLVRNATQAKFRPTPTLTDWLEVAYGRLPTQALYAANLSGKSVKAQTRELKAFLEWFRQNFPYYYDRCGSCGASLKEDLAGRREANGSVEEGDDGKCFVGYIKPNATEEVGRASRTELYQCHKCGSFTRFPRYNAAFHVIDHRRGRCGEYSVLMFEILRSLGHETRWVVDWADHVWVEVQIVDARGKHRWIHVDPCEAAVDENYLYQSWGKIQAYILAFYAPRNSIVSTQSGVPFVEDVTKDYTKDSWKTIHSRRDESEAVINSAIQSAQSYLRGYLQDNNFARTLKSRVGTR